MTEKSPQHVADQIGRISEGLLQQAKRMDERGHKALTNKSGNVFNTELKTDDHPYGVEHGEFGLYGSIKNHKLVNVENYDGDTVQTHSSKSINRTKTGRTTVEKTVGGKTIRINARNARNTAENPLVAEVELKRNIPESHTFPIEFEDIIPVSASVLAEMRNEIASREQLSQQHHREQQIDREDEISYAIEDILNDN